MNFFELANPLIVYYQNHAFSCATLPYISHTKCQRLTPRVAVLSRLDTPSNLRFGNLFFPPANQSRRYGYVETSTATPAARWSCLVLSAQETQPLADSGLETALTRDRVETYNALVRAGGPVTEGVDQGCAPDADEWKLLPSSPAFLDTHYLGADRHSMRQLQRRITVEIQSVLRKQFLESCSEGDFTRIKSCGLTGASDWLTDIDASLCMSDHDVATATNMRLGLPPSTEALPSVCVLCKRGIGDNHHLHGRPLLQKSINARHDRCQNGAARYARSNSCIVHTTPKTFESKVPDLEIAFYNRAVMSDISGI